MERQLEIPDAYQEYLRGRRQQADVDKIATLTMPVSDLAAIYSVCADVVDSTENLPAEIKRKWESILRSVGRAVQEAV